MKQFPGGGDFTLCSIATAPWSPTGKTSRHGPASWPSPAKQRPRGFAATAPARDCEIAAVAAGDEASLTAIINQVKSQGIRYLLLDLDYRRGDCTRYDFEGDWFGPSKPHQFRPAAH